MTHELDLDALEEETDSTLVLTLIRRVRDAETAAEGRGVGGYLEATLRIVRDANEENPASHYGRCWVDHAGCLAVLLLEVLEGHE